MKEAQELSSLPSKDETNQEKDHTEPEAVKTDFEEESSSSSQDHSEKRGRPSACVFVASLCSTKTDDELCESVTDHFKQWGTLSTVKVLRDTANRPYSFVQFTNDNDSKLAIQEGHNSMLNGRNIRCEAAKVNRTLFLSSKSSLLNNKVTKLLSQFGEIEQLVSSNEDGEILPDEDVSRFWYCKFVYRDDAIRAFANLTDDKTYKIEWAQNIEDIDINTKENSPVNEVKFDKYSVFVGQLISRITEEELKQRFEQHGEITDVTIVRRPSSSFSFIKFKEESSAASAVEKENHSMFNKKTMHVQYRELHNHANRSKQFRSNGVALAPPPINFGRRSMSKSDEPLGVFRRKISGPPTQTYPLGTKPKFNGNSSNNYNKVNSATPKPIYSKNYSFNRPKLANVKNPKSYKFNDFNYIRPKENVEEEIQTPPPSMQTSDTHTLVKSGYSPSSAVNSDKFDYTKSTKSVNEVTNEPLNVPYFYYIPTTDVGGGIGSPRKFTPPNTYYPSYQYYLPYDPSSQGNFRIPSFPVYYPGDPGYPFVPEKVDRS